MDTALFVGPKACEGAKESAFAAAGRAGYEHGVAWREMEVDRVEQGGAVGPEERQTLGFETVAGKAHVVELELGGPEFLRMLDAAHEAVETLHDGPPVGDDLEAVDEKVQAALHPAEGAGELGQLAERNGAGEESRCRKQKRHGIGQAKVNGFKRVEVDPADEGGVEVSDDAGKTKAEGALLGGLALDERRAFAVFAQTDETEAKVSL